MSYIAQHQYLLSSDISPFFLHLLHNTSDPSSLHITRRHAAWSATAVNVDNGCGGCDAALNTQHTLPSAPVSQPASLPSSGKNLPWRKLGVHALTNIPELRFRSTRGPVSTQSQPELAACLTVHIPDSTCCHAVTVTMETEYFCLMYFWSWSIWQTYHQHLTYAYFCRNGHMVTDHRCTADWEILYSTQSC